MVCGQCLPGILASFQECVQVPLTPYPTLSSSTWVLGLDPQQET